MTQLNQDPREDSVTNSGRGTAAMEGDVDMAGDKEVEEQDGEATANVIPETGITDVAWDPKDPTLSLTMRVQVQTKP